MKAISFCNQEMVLHPGGILLWPAQKMAVVADLHLEKASHFALQGQFLPPHETLSTLARLAAILEFCDVQTLLLLGDSFHDEYGYYRMNKKARKLFDTLFRRYSIHWIMGNHDGNFVPSDVSKTTEMMHENITFRHEAVLNCRAEISGHYHPKLRFNLKGQLVSHRCFIADCNRIILPSFGALTGGLDIRADPFARLIGKDHTCYLLGKTKLYEVPSYLYS